MIFEMLKFKTDLLEQKTKNKINNFRNKAKPKHKINNIKIRHKSKDEPTIPKKYIQIRENTIFPMVFIAIGSSCGDGDSSQ